MNQTKGSSRPTSNGFTSRSTSRPTGVVEENDDVFVYQTIMNEIDAIDKEIPAPAKQVVKVLEESIAEADKMVRGARSSNVLLLDTKVLHSSSNYLKETANTANLGEERFDFEEWEKAYIAKAQPIGEEAPIRALARAASLSIRRTIPSGWIQPLGGFEISSEEKPAQEKSNKSRNKEKEAEADKQKPEEKSKDIENNTADTESVKEAYRKLKKYYKKNGKNPIDYFCFVVDPTSYAQTSRNMYIVSHLVHDGRAKLEEYECSLVISPLKTSDSQMETGFMIEIDFSDWEGLIQNLEIQTAML